MVKRRICFRSDGNSDIGFGHVIRSLALADMLKLEFECVFYTRFINSYLKSEIKRSCEDSKILSSENHYVEFIESLRGDEIVVLDNYFFSTEYQQEIQSIGCSLVCIDDMHEQHFVADLVINHAEGVTKKQYSICENTQLLLGYKYALLRNVFLEYASKHNQVNLRLKKELDSLFICLGGADPNNLTKCILEETLKIGFKIIVVVVGAGYKFLSSIEKYCSSNLKIYQGISSHEIFKLMSHSSFGILPSSTIAMEGCAVRLPFITGYYVKNQINIYKGIVDSGLAIGFSEWNEKSIKIHLTKYIKEALSNSNSQKIVDEQIQKIDGLSGLRLLKKFKTLQK